MNRTRIATFLIASLLCFKSYGFDESKIKALRNEDFVLETTQILAFGASMGLIVHKSIEADRLSPDELTNYFIASAALTAGTLICAARRYQVQKKCDTLKELRFQAVLPEADFSTKKSLQKQYRLFNALEKPLLVSTPMAYIAHQVFMDDQAALCILTVGGLTLAMLGCTFRKFQLGSQIDVLEGRGLDAIGIVEERAAALGKQIKGMIMPSTMKHRHAPAA